MTAISRFALSCVASGLVFACTSNPAAPNPGDEQASTVVLSWIREGGFAGFCDELRISAAGDVTAASCRASTVTSLRLSSEDASLLNAWRNTFGVVSIVSNDGGAADGLTLKLTLIGKGQAQPTEAQRQELLAWAQRVYTETKRIL